MISPLTKNPFVFACGVPRSGTTLLQRMLNSHPEMAVANDTHFIPRALELTDKTQVEKAEAGAKIKLSDELAANVFQYHRFRRLGIGFAEFEAIRKRATSYQNFVAGLYSAFGFKQKKHLAGEKTPDYLRRLRLLHGLFPNAKLVHLVRDGRDVALSLLDWAGPTKGPGRIELWNRYPIGVCALWWKWLVEEARWQSAQLPPSTYLELEYKKLVAHPEPQMRLTCDFLGLEYSRDMIEYHRGKSKTANRLSAKSAWLAPQKGLRDWQTDMTREQVELFELLAGDTLKRYGFPVVSSGYSNRTIASAQECEAWWEKHFVPKHNKQPSTSDPLASEPSCHSMGSIPSTTDKAI